VLLEPGDHQVAIGRVLPDSQIDRRAPQDLLPRPPDHLEKALVHRDVSPVLELVDVGGVGVQVEHLAKRGLAPAAQGHRPESEVVGEVLQEAKLLLPEGRRIPGVHREDTDALSVEGDGKGRGRRVSPAQGLGLPGSERRIGGERAPHDETPLPDRRAGGPSPPRLVGPDDVRLGQESVVVPGVSHRADGSPVVVLGHPQPAHPVATGLDDDPAHLVEERLLGLGAKQCLVAAGEHQQGPARPLEGFLGRPEFDSALAHPGSPPYAAASLHSGSWAIPRVSTQLEGRLATGHSGIPRMGQRRARGRRPGASRPVRLTYSE
jgi:hypothetical protein